METKHFATWPEFCIHARNLVADDSNGRFQFRGQSDDRWDIESTLERERASEITLSKYQDIIFTIKHECEARASQRWTVSSGEHPIKHAEWFRNRDDDLMEFLVYLRHHGFPSPLVDWTFSPFVAAFFAFRYPKKPDMPDKSEGPDHVAIFALNRPDHTEVKPFGNGIPKIIDLRHHLRSNVRHFNQQCAYTACIVPNKDGSDFYGKHMAGLNEESQFHKFTIPYSQRREVIHYLANHNITAWSLFGSEDALAETLATREFFLNR